jgi:hypothetical protein
MKREYCIFCYSTKQARAAGEMDYTIEADDIDEANETAQQELDEGMYAAVIFRRPGGPTPMVFVEAHIQPLIPA